MIKRLNLIYALLMAAMTLAILSDTVLKAYAAETTDKSAIEEPISLTPIIEIEEDYITVGDIFVNSGRYAKRVVARAPAPGEEITLSARWLWKVSKAFGLGWQPTSRLDTARVIRASSIIEADTITAALSDAYFSETGEDELVELELDQSFLESIHLPADQAPTVRIDRFELDRNSGRFSATISAPATGRPLSQRTISGRFHRMVELPVPAARLAAGTVISDRHLTDVRMREDQLGTNTVLDRASLIGQEAQRSLSAGRALRSGDVKPPRLVRKNDIVTIVLKTAQMTITTQGRALENGAEGDLIRVQNAQSRAHIDAVVSGANKVQVLQPQQTALVQE